MAALGEVIWESAAQSLPLGSMWCIIKPQILAVISRYTRIWLNLGLCVQLLV